MPKTLDTQGFSGLRKEVVRSEGRSSRTSVQQALTSISTKKRPLLAVSFFVEYPSAAHRRVSRFPVTVRDRQSGHFLETGSLYLPPAALRLFPPSANRILEFAKNTHFGGCSFFAQRAAFCHARAVAASAASEWRHLFLRSCR